MFRSIKGYEDAYPISELGEIKSLRSNVGIPEILLRQTLGKGGYLTVVLCYKGTRKTVRVNRLVAEAFIANPDNKPTVNHIDGNKQNNKASNLEWATHKENIEHAYKNNLISNIGETAVLAKFTNAEAETIRKDYNNGMTYQKLADTYQVNKSTIGKIIRNVTYK